MDTYWLASGKIYFLGYPTFHLVHLAKLTWNLELKYSNLFVLIGARNGEILEHDVFMSRCEYVYTAIITLDGSE